MCIIVEGEMFTLDRLRNRLAKSGIWTGLHDQIVDYLFGRTKPGNFLGAVLANDLITAVRCGGEHEIESLVPLVRFLMRHSPVEAWHSHDAVDAWTNENRMGLA